MLTRSEKCNASFGTPEAFLAVIVKRSAMHCPSPPSNEPRRGAAGDGYATLRRKRGDASAIKDACAAWMRAHGARASAAQRRANAERMQRCYRVMVYCDQQMQYLQMQRDAVAAAERAREGVPVEFPGMRPMYERVAPKRKAGEADISRRAHAYRNIGPPSRKRSREVDPNRAIEDEDLEQYQSEYRRLFPALDDGRRGIRGLYGPGDAYGDDGGTVEFGSTRATLKRKRE